ncbi:MAG: LLM class flavin-dependent oxidoreductase [Actinomycetota bacterium]|nr:LLM class flavin-dependent oxidoreductase [Actinomycetota bacterium]
MSIHFGLTLPQRGAFIGIGSINDILSLAPRAEETGLFSSVWVGDSLTAKPRPEAIALLGSLAGMTDQLRLGVGCMASFPVRDPALFAYQWATLDLISEGRMDLAACTGIVTADGASRAEGRHFGGVSDIDRAARMEENIQLCRLLWSGQEVDFDGRFHSYSALRIQPKPVQDPCPIWIAANPAPGKYWERSLRRVAKLADGFQTCALFPGILRLMVDDVVKYRREDQNDSDNFPVMAYHNVNIGTDREQCLNESKQFLDAYYGPVFSPEQVESWTAAGHPDEVISDIGDLIDQGATAVTLRMTSTNQDAQFALLTEHVLPALV